MTASLPDWPRLMDTEKAAEYFSISASTFLKLDIKPRRIHRRKLWDRLDLDRFADRLDGQPLDAEAELREATECERRFLEGRRGKS